MINALDGTSTPVTGPTAADQFAKTNQVHIIEHPSGAVEVHSADPNIPQSAMPGILSRWKAKQQKGGK